MKLAGALIALVRLGTDAQTIAGGETAPVVKQDDVWYGPQQIVRAGLPGGNKRAFSEDGERRYEDLEDIASKYWRKRGETGKNRFDERKYWAYGCHCFLLGDRPMSAMGAGRPVDSLDVKCKAYKDCQKCVREKHGDDCIGEFVRYTWRYSTKKGDFESNNKAGTCERELFECDLQFVKDTYAQKAVFNEDYHAFWSTTGFDREDPQHCVVGGGTVPVQHECCGGHNGPYYWIGLNKHQCCSGVVKGANDQC